MAGAHLVFVLMQAAHGVGVRWRSQVIHLDAAVPTGCQQHRVILLAPRHIVQPVRGVKGSGLHHAAWRHLRRRQAAREQRACWGAMGSMAAWAMVGACSGGCEEGH